MGEVILRVTSCSSWMNETASSTKDTKAHEEGLASMSQIRHRLDIQRSGRLNVEDVDYAGADASVDGVAVEGLHAKRGQAVGVVGEVPDFLPEYSAITQ